MADEFYKEIRNPSRRSTDRYKNCVILEDVETGEVLLSTRDSITIPSHPNDQYHRVQSNEVTRLDILAHRYYQNPLLWWVIATANNIYDPFIPLDPGDLIRIPALESLYGNNGVLL